MASLKSFTVFSGRSPASTGWSPSERYFTRSSLGSLGFFLASSRRLWCSHFFIVLFFLLFSWYLMLREKTIPAMVFSALNLLMFGTASNVADDKRTAAEQAKA